MKSNINSVEIHPQPSNNNHTVDGALVRCGHGNKETMISSSPWFPGWSVGTGSQGQELTVMFKHPENHAP